MYVRVRVFLLKLELLIYDEKGDARVWGMKFHNKKVKMNIAAALLKAKKEFRPPGPRGHVSKRRRRCYPLCMTVSRLLQKIKSSQL